MRADQLLFLVRVLDAIDIYESGGTPALDMEVLAAVLQDRAGISLDDLGKQIFEGRITDEIEVLLAFLQPNAQVMRNVVLDVTELFTQTLQASETFKRLVRAVASNKITEAMLKPRKEPAGSTA